MKTEATIKKELAKLNKLLNTGSETQIATKAMIHGYTEALSWVISIRNSTLPSSIYK